MHLCISNFSYHLTPANKKGDKIIVETLSSNGVTSENKTIHTYSSSRPVKVGVLKCGFLDIAWTAAQYYMEGMGKEKFHFALLELEFLTPKGQNEARSF